MSSGADGWESNLVIQDALPFSGSATPLRFKSESLAKQSTILNDSGMDGSASEHSELSREGQSTVSGQITLDWSPTGGAVLLPLILGGTPSGTTFPLADTAPAAWQYQIDRVSEVFNYTDVRVNKATWKGQSGGPVEVLLDLLGVDEVLVAAGAGQAFVVPLDPGYVFSDLAISVTGDARSIFDIELTVDNRLASRYANSKVPTRIARSAKRQVAVSFTTPFGPDEVDLYNVALGGIEVILTATNGNYSTVWAMGKVQFPAMSPVVPGQGEIPLKMTGIARMFGTTRELIVTHDSSA